MPEKTASIAIAGAGSIGCYVGGCLVRAGRTVRFLGRPATAEALHKGGLHLSGLDGLDARLAPGQLQASSDPAAALKGAGVILVAVKSGQTAEIADTIVRHASPGAVVVSLQNGTRNVATLRQLLADRHAVVPGMVPFNVRQSEDADGVLHVHRATSGTILIGTNGPPHLKALLDVPHAQVATHDDMEAVQWGKLLLNLNNALNALSGIPLAQQLADRDWRRLLADQMREAPACFRAAGIRSVGTEGIPVWLAPPILALPDALFHLVARRMLAIDPEARSSMWEDLQRHRMTEVDHLQGAVLELARMHAVPTPVIARVTAAIKAAEKAAAGAPHLRPRDLRSGAKSA